MRCWVENHYHYIALVFSDDDWKDTLIELFSDGHCASWPEDMPEGEGWEAE